MTKHPLRIMIATMVVAYGLLAVTILMGKSPTLGLDLQGGISVNLQPVKDGKVDDSVSPEQLDQAIGIIRKRVDALGVAEPEVEDDLGGKTRIAAAEDRRDGRLRSRGLRPSFCVLSRVLRLSCDEAGVAGFQLGPGFGGSAVGHPSPFASSASCLLTAFASFANSAVSAVPYSTTVVAPRVVDSAYFASPTSRLVCRLS